MSERAISDIRIGKRHRSDMGDIEGLAASIRELGLFHPIVIRPDGTLIAGKRRLAACRLLGWSRVPVTHVDLEEIVRGELAENVVRKDLLPTEMVAIGRNVEEIERAAARERQTANLKRGDKRPVVATFHDGGKSRDKVAAYAGVSGRTYEKARAVAEAAEAEPERFGKFAQDMDRTGRVNGVFRRLRVMRQAQSIRAEPPPLPGRGPYRVIVADPPWPYDIRKDDPSRRGTTPYPQMSIAQICAMPVAPLAYRDCILWLWTTNLHMREAFGVLDAWGFEHRTILTWVKDRMGTGDWLRGQTEHALMAVRGKPIVELTNQTTVLHGPVRAHSQKPEEFYEFVEKLCPAPRYAELFSRHTRKNWDGHGDEYKPAEARRGACRRCL